MKKLLLAGILLVAAPALAGSYDDFGQGVTAFTEGRSDDLIIAHMSRALAAGDLARNLQPTAYFDRAIAYMRQHQCALARADLDMALKLRPGYIEATAARGEAEACLGAIDDALADFTAVTDAKPSGWTYGIMGRLEWTAGKFTLAADDFQKALKIEPQSPYNLLWLGISRMRDGTFDARAFADHFSDMSVSDWPRPVLLFFLGRSTAAAMIAEAANGDAKDVPGHKCEADFYAGEWQLTHGDVPAGKTLFQDAASICPKTLVERGPVELELKRLQ
jgi:lipoprotein NlpI